MRRRVLLQVFAVYGEPGVPSGRDVGQAACKRHLSELPVMAVGLPVCRHVHEPGRGTRGEGRDQPTGKPPAVLQQISKRDLVRDPGVVEEDGDRLPRREAAEVRHCCIDTPVARSRPLFLSDLPHPCGLGGMQDRKEDAVSGHDVKRRVIDRKLGQPHPLRHSRESVGEVAYPPDDLRFPIPHRRKRHDQVVVWLGDGRSVPGIPLLALSVCRNDCGMQIRLLPLQPRKKCRTGGEADLPIGIDKLQDPPLPIQDAGSSVRGVALGRDPLVPVMVGICGVLQIDPSGPRVLA
ncbi:hypothetical protein ASZ90_010205 [hydrocarbon metagenome]|uniref:Uncharacterized protein n=1 Tax=hydrocarbon metagenome TaxID=938273 RepID=A0A0W8FGN7_9ZZZZ